MRRRSTCRRRIRNVVVTVTVTVTNTGLASARSRRNPPRGSKTDRARGKQLLVTRSLQPQGQIPSVQHDESLVENPGFPPGFRPARRGLRPAHDKLRTFPVENLVESVIDLSQHVAIDLPRFRPNL